MAECSKGWNKRCIHAKGKRCTCSCHGINHGSALAQVELFQTEGCELVNGAALRKEDTDFKDLSKGILCQR